MKESLGSIPVPWKITVVLAIAGLVVLPHCATASSAPEDMFPQGEPLIYPGQRDAGDRYLSSVMVMVGSSGVSGTCTGILLHQQLVITAGHCVCGRRAPRASDKPPGRPARKDGSYQKATALQGVEVTNIIDTQGPCATAADVFTVSYASSQGQAQERGKPKASHGGVMVHPGFEIIFGRRGDEAPHVLWSNADLAAILLEEPVPFEVPPLDLADAEVQAGDLITMIGFGPGSTFAEYGVRHYGDNKVSRLILLETESAVFRTEETRLPDGAAASHARKGDSGGACIKKGARNMLVGITTVGAQAPGGKEMSIFTSVYSHRRWLLQMLERAGNM